MADRNEKSEFLQQRVDAERGNPPRFVRAATYRPSTIGSLVDVFLYVVADKLNGVEIGPPASPALLRLLSSRSSKQQHLRRPSWLPWSLNIVILHVVTRKHDSAAFFGV